jgi:hypothetical protein
MISLLRRKERKGMRLESVRSLKEEIVAEILPQQVVARRALPRETALGVSLPARVLPPPFALGIEGRGGNYSLAIRIQEVVPGLQRNLDRIFQKARGEASMKVVGRLIKQHPWHSSRNRPLLIGSSVSHPDVTAGTIGCFVTSDGTDRLLLSNNHVLADENRASPGDKILQPCRADGGIPPGDCIGALARFVALSESRKNRIDAAVALLDPSVPEDPVSLTGLGVLRGTRADTPETGEAVFKLGRTTGLTRGRVSAFEVDDLWVHYDLGVLGFDGQLEIEGEGTQAFSLGGDSGSLVVDERLHAIGLLFAGNDADISYAHPLDEVFQALGLRLP